ncbi:LANO_0H01706g1_1 [Lachancea nothofagi CBS 11611]|uniref:LANO_0H01706g1_1 n=1 Tax=Lachancea nothofagi CBS 11611 TaxID=1266666 RepID=A0A1G4KL14_9SACH|nr:LANO_0H01706g1_1 [Lachancea nothofagi CBS 11611]
MPPLIHKWNHSYAILSSVAFPHKKILFAGTHDSKILCFDLSTYNLAKTIQLGDEEEAHTRSSVLCLAKSQDERYLFSAGADSLVRIWSVGELSPNGGVFITELTTLYSLIDIGDIFSIKYLDAHQTIVFGCQNANMMYMSGIMDRLNGKPRCDDVNRLPQRRYDRFFDSNGPGSQGDSARCNSPSPGCYESRKNHTIMEVPLRNTIPYAHNSFIYSIQPLSGANVQLPDAFYQNGLTRASTEFIISGGGDGLSKIWALSMKNKGCADVKLLAEMDNNESVLCQVVQFPFLYCGLNGGFVKIWDLNLDELVATLQSSSKCDIVSISVYEDHIFASHEKGVTKFFKDETFEWLVDDGLVLSTEILRKKCTGSSFLRLAAGGKSGSLTLYNISELVEETHHRGSKINTKISEAANEAQKSKLKLDYQAILDNDNMQETLRELMSFKTVSAFTESQYVIDSRRCASYLQQAFTSLGASCNLLPTGSNDNPLVHALFKGKSKSKPKSKIVWYGHYDIISPGDPSKWTTDPYMLTCENGFLKGRGVTDNKGPLVAAMYSAGSAFLEGTLENDIIFLVEGQEESNSQGFVEAVKKHQNLLGNDVDWILFSNSYWIDEKIPCLNYGLRGVINARVTIWSDAPDRHSGLDGGVHREPTTDLSRVLSKLQDDDGHVLIPGFYAPLGELKAEEEARFKEIIQRADLCESVTLEKLMAKWTKPSLSITNMKVSGPGNSTVIPRSASATISIRVVPEQEVHEIKESLESFVTQSFKRLETPNHFKFQVLNEAEPWLGNPENAVYQILREEIRDAWGIDPLFIREGGSIPQVRFLERTLNASAIQIPCGQSTDNAHLNNEQLRIENWYKMRQILHKAFNRL